MTIDEFVEKLKETPYKWELLGNSIRTKGPLFKLPGSPRCRCPITAVCENIKGRFRDSGYYIIAANAIGLSAKDANFIANAADCRNPSRPELRTQLLEAVGLTK